MSVTDRRKSPIQVSAQAQPPVGAIEDIVASLLRLNIVFYLAWSDTRARYRRSVLGPLWLTLGTAIGVLGLGYVWSELFRLDKATFIPLLTTGLVVWQMLASCITESAGVFSRQASVIRNMQMPYFIHPLQLVLRHTINFAHNILVVVAVIIFFAVPVNVYTFLVVPGIVLVFLNLLWLSLLLGLLGMRFRDIEYALTAFIPLLFFVSPVLFRPDHLPFSAWLIWLNPLSHFIEVVRAPMLGMVPDWFVYATTIALLIVGWTLTLVLFNARRRHIPFWV